MTQSAKDVFMNRPFSAKTKKIILALRLITRSRTIRGGAAPLILNLLSSDVYAIAPLDPGTDPSGL